MSANQLALLVAAMIATVSANGCKTVEEAEDAPVVTLDEAKKIAAEFAKATLQPPPRSAQRLIEKFDPSRDIYDACETGVDVQALDEIEEDYGTVGSIPKFVVYARRANQYFLQGDANRALEANNRSLKKYSSKLRRNPAHLQTDAEILAERAVILAATGNFVAAEEAIRNATLPFRTRQPHITEAAIARGVGAIAKSRGSLTEAESRYRRAIEIVKDTQLSPWNKRIETLNVMQAELATVLMLEGKHLEAELIVREALRYRTDRSIRFSRGSAYILLKYAEILFNQGRLKEAIFSARIAIAIYQKICSPESSLFVAESRNIIAESQVAQRNWRYALEEFQAIESALTKSPEIFYRRFENNVSWAIALMLTGKVRIALEKLDEAVKQLENQFGSDVYEVVEAKVLRALAKISEHGTVELGTNDRQLVNKLLALSSTGVGDGLQFIGRDLRLSLVLDLLIKIETSSSNEVVASNAFEYAQYAHRGKVRHAYAASLARSFSRDPEFATLIRQEQDASLQLTALRVSVSNLYELAGGEHRSTSLEEIQAQISRLELARQAIRRKILEEHPEYAQSINPPPTSVESLRRKLGQEEALILAYVGEDQTYVWAISRRGHVAFGKSVIGLVEISALVGRIRKALEPNARTLGEIPAHDLSAAYQLFEILLKPISKGWQNAKSLLVIADGPLGYLPLTVLPTRPIKLPVARGLLFSEYRKVPWLARTHAVTMLPSVESLNSPLKKALLTGFHSTAKHNATKAVSPSSETMRTI